MKEIILGLIFTLLVVAVGRLYLALRARYRPATVALYQGHGIVKGMIVQINGEPYYVTAVTETSMTIRPAA